MSKYGLRDQFKTISIPSHPDYKDVPVSLVHVPLSRGRYVTICGPLGRKTVTALLGTIEACRETLTVTVQDYEI